MYKLNYIGPFENVIETLIKRSNIQIEVMSGLERVRESCFHWAESIF